MIPRVGMSYGPQYFGYKPTTHLEAAVILALVWAKLPVKRRQKIKAKEKLKNSMISNFSLCVPVFFRMF